MARRGRLILIVDPDLDFVEDTRLLLSGERLLTARSLEEAEEIAVGGRVDAAILGPSFGNEAGVRSASALLAADPTIHLVLAANVVTNRVLLAALQTGFTDVVDTPLTARKLAVSLAPRARTAGPSSVIDLVVEVAPAQSAAAPVAVVAALAPAPVPVAAPPAPAAPVAPAPVIAPALADGLSPIAAAPLESIAAPQPVPVAAPAPVPVAAAMPATVPPAPPEPEVDGVPLADAPLTAPAAPAINGVPIPPIPQSAPPRPLAAESLPPPFPPPPQAVSPVREAEAEPEPEPAEEDGPAYLPGRPQPRAATRSYGAPAQTVARAGGEPAGLSNGSRMIMVMAGKGGSGKSVTATNLALALTFAVGEDAVVIVDADLQFGDVALLLQMDPTRNLAEVARQVDDLSEARLDALLLRHESGLRVLPAPLQPAAADSIPPKAIVQVVEKLRRLFRYVVVDTGGVLDDVLLTLLDQADDVVVVVDMDLPSVKNTKVALDILRAGGYPMERMRLVVNRINSKARLDLVELERSLGLRTAAAIPSDRLVPQSVNEGVPVVVLSPRSRVARAFTGLARQFLPDGGRRGS